MAKVKVEKSPLQSLRFKHLKDASKEIGIAHQKEAFIRRIGDPNFPPTHRQKSYDLGAMARKAQLERDKAGQNLAIACAACALRSQCTLVGSLNRWERSHPYTKNPPNKPSFQEDRAHMLSRINREPDAACEPKAITPLPEEQLELTFTEHSTTQRQNAKTSLNPQTSHYDFELEN